MTRPDCPRCGSDLIAAAVTDSPSEWVEELRGGGPRPTAVVDHNLNWLCRACGHRWQQAPEAVGDAEDIEEGEASADPPPMRQYAELLKLGPQRPFDTANAESTLKPLPDRRRRGGIVGPAMTILAIAGIVVLVALQSPRSVPDSGVPAPSQTPVDVGGSEPASPSPPSPPEPRGVRTVLLVEQPCWVRVVADGEIVEEITLAPGDTAVYRAKREMQLRLGNAGGVTLRVNGELYPTGGSGDVVDLQLTWQDGEVLIERA
ncbi:MAG TPA: RodZ domain-containing protein [Actinomycetota bacterium]|nr:RodZ domain-containing protein [Actinomycetota bacterium]